MIRVFSRLEGLSRLKPCRFLLLASLCLLTTTMDCHAMTDAVSSKLAMAFYPIQQHYGADFVMPIRLDGTIEILYRVLDRTKSEQKPPLGPPDVGFVLETRTLVSNEGSKSLDLFKPKFHPFGWENYPEKDNYPWTTEFHLYDLGRNQWLVVSVYCGKNTNRELVQELLATISKSVEQLHQFFEPSPKSSVPPTSQPAS